MVESATVRSSPAPLGATVLEGGVNFSLFSRVAEGVELLLFEDAEDLHPRQRIPLDPVRNHTYHYWHVAVPGLRAGQLYGYRVIAPGGSRRGEAEACRTLLDPYARALVVPRAYDRSDHSRPAAPGTPAIKSVVVDPAAYDWEGDRPLRRPVSSTVIYEMHVRGFTASPSSGLEAGRRGTYAGLIEKIPYLQSLGITAVELLPVFAFDAQDAPPGRTNYWGYSPINMFAPHPGYSSCAGPLAAVNEFRDMVKALHRAGIEVILDVVYNHTCEGDWRGPTLSFRGIDNATYYLLEDGGRSYCNYSGCGNTLRADHPVVRRMIRDSLRYWVKEMHVDGFRFDLASVLARDSAGAVLADPPILWDIETDPDLAGIKLIAEAWDAAGLVQVGSFVGDSWMEWNGHFRDVVRDFMRGADGAAGAMADCMLGSHALFGHERREAEQSVNYITCHDGFTLNDLVSYNHKHNEANGEGNRDGSADNRSWNCGVEGGCDLPEVEDLRQRQCRNFLVALLSSLGVPMLAMGDEVRRSQAGNNNAYCQDSPLSWFDWSQLESEADLLRFTRLLIGRRTGRVWPFSPRPMALSRQIGTLAPSWHGILRDQPDWRPESHTFGCCVRIPGTDQLQHYVFNAFWQPLRFEVPQPPASQRWRVWIDTARPAPADIHPIPEQAPELAGSEVISGARSVQVLISAP